MATRRMNAVSDLPRLATIFPDFKKLPSTKKQNQELHRILKKLALSLQDRDNHSFYSMAEISAFFGVTKSVVAQVYTELQNEGILLRLRGFKTILKSKQTKPHHPIQGVVGFPIWLWGYCHNVEWRRFFISLEEHLSHHGIIPHFIFYGRELESAPETFFNRLIQRNLNYLFWFKPLPEYVSILDGVRDRGIHPVILTDDRDRHWNCAQYHLQEADAIQQAAREWTKRGIREVVILNTPNARALNDAYGAWFSAQGIRWKVVFPDVFNFSPELKSIVKKPAHAVYIPDDQVVSMFSLARPDLLAGFLRTSRVLLKGAIHSLPEYFQDCQVDILATDWDGIARVIASDLATGKICDPSMRAGFSVKLCLSVDAPRQTCML